MSDSAGLYDPSPRALRPLMATFWSATGWRRSPAWPEPEVMAEAVRAGVMFSEPVQRDHDGWVRAAREAASQVSTRKVGEAFLASLSSRRLDLRSALGSYAVGRHLPEHSIAPGHTGRCQECALWRRTGEDAENLNILNFERFKWGGVRHDCVSYIAFDLEQFTRAPKMHLREEDVALGRQMISVLRGLPAATTAAQAAPQLSMIKGNKDERDTLMQILGLCGILRTPEHPGYATSFVPHDQRTGPSQRFWFGSYPIWWWTAADGVDDEALRLFLPQV